MEMSLNFAKSGNVLKIILPVKKFTQNNKSVNKYYACKRKLKKKSTGTQS